MKKAGPWLVVALLVVVIGLMATDTLSIDYESDRADVPEAIEDVADNVEDAAEELSGE